MILKGITGISMENTSLISRATALGSVEIGIHSETGVEVIRELTRDINTISVPAREKV